MLLTIRVASSIPCVAIHSFAYRIDEGFHTSNMNDTNSLQLLSTSIQ